MNEIKEDKRAAEPVTSGISMQLPQEVRANEPGLTLNGLEAVYDALAAAIDQAGPEKSELFLVKLALLNAQALGDERLFAEQVQKALNDL